MRQLLTEALVIFCVLWLGQSQRADAQSNGVLREVYTGIGGTAISDLTNSASFPDSPTTVEVISDSFEAPTDVDDNYGQRMSAYILAPATGNYLFWIASDDNSTLFLSTDDTPAKKRVIASVPGWTPSRQWGVFSQQRSAAISLAGGQRYYIEALMKEGSGGDNLAVRWQLPSGVIEEPIPASRLLVFGLGPPQISQQPTNVAVVEGGSATFTVRLTRAFGASYQWLRNSANIPGATNSSFTLAPLTLADNNSQFRCFVTNAQGSTNSNTAILNVSEDTTPPTIASVANLGNKTVVSVLYSEPVEASSTTTAANYSINNGVGTPLSAKFGPDARTVVLTTSPLSFGVTYTLTVNNVRDRATTPNTIATNSQKTFTLDFTPLDAGFIIGASEPVGPSSRRTGLIISEIMYHPVSRADAKNLEFVELFNTLPWSEDISGYRLSGAVDFIFPANTVIKARSYLVVAPAPADVQSVYGITGVFGGFTNHIQNGPGTIRLRNRRDAVLLEADYSDEFPYPVAADGLGHSLVLARPTWGEGHPSAWAASDAIGGSPGGAEAARANPYRTVVINEFLAHTDDPEVDYIELFNYGTTSVNLGGCILSDDPATNKFVIPANVVIPPRGFVYFTQTNMNFALSAAGETIFLKSADQTRIIDAVKFQGQENGVASGRYPDGAPNLFRLASTTPGAPNSPLRVSDVVINEVMYNPISGDSADEYVELHNRGATAVNLAGWKLSDGISYTFASNAVIAVNGYLVVANDAGRLLTNYPNLNTNNTVGNYGGTLANGGERIALTMPDTVVSTNSSGVAVTNLIHIVVDEVTYRDGGRWGKWADGGGSSLELIDPRGDHRRASNWGESEESSRSAWTNIEFTGLLDNGNDNADSFQVFLQGEGECLVDNVEVFARGGPNLIANPNFESGLNGWHPQGTHDLSSLETSGGYGGGQCLHLRASGRGDTGANRLRADLTSALSPGTTVTLRAKVRWLKGNPEILLRLHGNWLEAYGNILTARNLGTPGLPNSRAEANTGPAIEKVAHSPVLPAGGQAVTVTASVHDPDELSSLVLKYRIDPSTNLTSVGMVYNGAGLYSATIPGQAAGALAAFHIVATDNNAAIASARYPDDAPARECLVRFGETLPGGSIGTYRLWLTSSNVARWTSRERNSNEPLDATFVYGNARVAYNIGTLYSGSPWHTPGYNGPTNNICDYILAFPADEPMLGRTDFVIASLGNLDNDPTAQREQAAFWMLHQLGVPTLYRRHVNLFVNGVKRGLVYEDAQQPSGEVVDEWFPDDNNGDLHKIEDWFEFDNSGDGKLFNVDATLEDFTTTGGAKKLARYRWNWRKRAVNNSANNYTNLFALVDAVNAQQPEPYTSRTDALMDYEEWMRVFAVEHIVGNWDSYGYNRGKNMYGYKPENGKWTLLAWDIDFVMDDGGDPATTIINPADPSLPVNDPVLRTLLAFPPFQRAFWRALQDAVNGPLVSTNVAAMMNAKYNGLTASGVPAASPSGTLSWISSRRSYILTQLNSVNADFAITSNGGNNFSTNRNYVSISGTAPIGVKTIVINGISYPLTWTSVSNWTANIALGPGANSLALAGYDLRGAPVTNGADSITITYTGAPELPQDHVVINEIMYNPAGPNASFLELYNTSTVNAFDLSGFRLDGADFVFAGGSFIQPNSFLVIANDAAAFAAAYGSSIPLAGEFAGKLSNGGETLKLVNPGATPEQDLIIDQVTYDSAPPWPPAADGFGPSLQLIDPLQDNNRVANWAVGATNNSSQYTPGAPNSVKTTLTSLPLVWLNEVQPNNVTGITDRFGHHHPWVELHNSSASAINLGGYYLANNYTNLTQWAFPTNTLLDPGQFLVVYLDGNRGESVSTELHTSFVIPPVSGSVALTKVAGARTTIVDYLNYNLLNADRSYGAFPDGTPGKRGNFYYATPGGTNNNVWPALPVTINEWMAANTHTLFDPADGNYDDWFELYNAGPTPVDLSGYTLTDNITNRTQFTIPPGYTVPAGGYLLVWADNGASQNSTNTPNLHVNFKLNQDGEGIWLFSPTGTNVDGVSFGAQTNDVSQGRWPDGNSGQFYFMTTPTPGAANITGVNSNSPPVLATIGNKSVNEGSPVTFTATSIDPDYSQTLTYTLDPGAPVGSSINPSSGVFLWTPTEVQGPGTYPVTVRVTDNGSPALSTAVTFDITVNEVNTAPVLAPISDRSITAGTQLVITNTASDLDIPVNALTFSLDPGAPGGAVIDAGSGVFTWTPSTNEAPRTNTITVRVTDNGSPSLSDARSFMVMVNAAAALRVTGINVSPNRVVTLTWSSQAGKTYRVQFKDSLDSADWNTLGNYNADGSSSSASDNISGKAQGFYRIEQIN